MPYVALPTEIISLTRVLLTTIKLALPLLSTIRTEIQPVAVPLALVKIRVMVVLQLLVEPLFYQSTDCRFPLPIPTALVKESLLQPLAQPQAMCLPMAF